jgi:hypothetical protein
MPVRPRCWPGWMRCAGRPHEEGRHIDLRIAALDALGRKDDAQDQRWAVFQRWLSTDHLRAYMGSQITNYIKALRTPLA